MTTKVQTELLAAGAAAANLGAGSITTTMLASNAVTTAKIADANVTPAKLSQPLTLGTTQTTTSGTSKDFTGIPSWVTRITVIFNGVSFNSTGSMLVQLGTASGLETTSYNTGGSNFVGTVTSTSGFIMANGTASFTVIGHMTFTHMGSNVWVGSHAAMAGSGYFLLGGGTKTLAAALDRIRITSSTGTDTFDAGSVNIIYE